MAAITLKMSMQPGSSLPLLLTISLSSRIGDKIESMTLQDIDKDVFRDFTRRHPALLFPAFELQRVFRKHCLGETFWKKLTQKRIDLSNGQFLSVGQIIEMLNREPLQRKIDREGGLEKVNIEALIAAQHQPGSIRRIATADREDESTPKSQPLHLMANTITMASHSKRRASAAKVVPVSPASTDPVIDISAPGPLTDVQSNLIPSPPLPLRLEEKTNQSAHLSRCPAKQKYHGQ
jgi:hypothetical protein